MKAERWRQIDVLFKEALERPPGERASFLLVACGQDDALRREIEALLASDEDAASFIDAPAYQFAASLIAGDDAPSLIGEKLGHYQIVSILGRGGMGEVYRARDLNLNRHVAAAIDLSTDAGRRAAVVARWETNRLYRVVARQVRKDSSGLRSQSLLFSRDVLSADGPAGRGRTGPRQVPRNGRNDSRMVGENDQTN